MATVLIKTFPTGDAISPRFDKYVSNFANDSLLGQCSRCRRFFRNSHLGVSPLSSDSPSCCNCSYVFETDPDESKISSKIRRLKPVYEILKNSNLLDSEKLDDSLPSVSQTTRSNPNTTLNSVDTKNTTTVTNTSVTISNAISTTSSASVTNLTSVAPLTVTSKVSNLTENTTRSPLNRSTSSKNFSGNGTNQNNKGSTTVNLENNQGSYGLKKHSYNGNSSGLEPREAYPSSSGPRAANQRDSKDMNITIEKPPELNLTSTTPICTIVQTCSSGEVTVQMFKTDAFKPAFHSLTAKRPSECCLKKNYCIPSKTPEELLEEKLRRYGFTIPSNKKETFKSSIESKQALNLDEGTNFTPGDPNNLKSMVLESETATCKHFNEPMISKVLKKPALSSSSQSKNRFAVVPPNQYPTKYVFSRPEINRYSPSTISSFQLKNTSVKNPEFFFFTPNKFSSLKIFENSNSALWSSQKAVINKDLSSTSRKSELFSSNPINNIFEISSQFPTTSQKSCIPSGSNFLLNQINREGPKSQPFETQKGANFTFYGRGPLLARNNQDIKNLNIPFSWQSSKLKDSSLKNPSIHYSESSNHFNKFQSSVLHERGHETSTTSETKRVREFPAIQSAYQHKYSPATSSKFIIPTTTVSTNKQLLPASKKFLTLSTVPKLTIESGSTANPITFLSPALNPVNPSLPLPPLDLLFLSPSPPLSIQPSLDSLFPGYSSTLRSIAFRKDYLDKLPQMKSLSIPEEFKNSEKDGLMRENEVGSSTISSLEVQPQIFESKVRVPLISEVTTPRQLSGQTTAKRYPKNRRPPSQAIINYSSPSFNIPYNPKLQQMDVTTPYSLLPPSATLKKRIPPFYTLHPQIDISSVKNMRPLFDINRKLLFNPYREISAYPLTVNVHNRSNFSGSKLLEFPIPRENQYIEAPQQPLLEKIRSSSGMPKFRYGPMDISSIIGYTTSKTGPPEFIDFTNPKFELPSDIKYLPKYPNLYSLRSNNWYGTSYYSPLVRSTPVTWNPAVGFGQEIPLPWPSDMVPPIMITSDLPLKISPSPSPSPHWPMVTWPTPTWISTSPETLASSIQLTVTWPFVTYPTTDGPPEFQPNITWAFVNRPSTLWPPVTRPTATWATVSWVPPSWFSVTKPASTDYPNDWSTNTQFPPTESSEISRDAWIPMEASSTKPAALWIQTTSLPTTRFPSTEAPEYWLHMTMPSTTWSPITRMTEKLSSEEFPAFMTWGSSQITNNKPNISPTFLSTQTESTSDLFSYFKKSQIVQFPLNSSSWNSKHPAFKSSSEKSPGAKYTEAFENDYTYNNSADEMLQFEPEFMLQNSWEKLLGTDSDQFIFHPTFETTSKHKCLLYSHNINAHFRLDENSNAYDHSRKKYSYSDFSTSSDKMKNLVESDDSKNVINNKSRIINSLDFKDNSSVVEKTFDSKMGQKISDHLTDSLINSGYKDKSEPGRQSFVRNYLFGKRKKTKKIEYILKNFSVQNNGLPSSKPNFFSQSKNSKHSKLNNSILDFAERVLFLDEDGTGAKKERKTNITTRNVMNSGENSSNVYMRSSILSSPSSNLSSLSSNSSFLQLNGGNFRFTVGIFPFGNLTGTSTLNEVTRKRRWEKLTQKYYSSKPINYSRLLRPKRSYISWEKDLPYSKNNLNKRMYNKMRKKVSFDKFLEGKECKRSKNSCSNTFSEEANYFLTSNDSSSRKKDRAYNPVVKRQAFKRAQAANKKSKRREVNDEPILPSSQVSYRLQSKNSKRNYLRKRYLESHRKMTPNFQRCTNHRSIDSTVSPIASLRFYRNSFPPVKTSFEIPSLKTNNVISPNSHDSFHRILPQASKVQPFAKYESQNFLPTESGQAFVKAYPTLENFSAKYLNNDPYFTFHENPSTVLMKPVLNQNPFKSKKTISFNLTGFSGHVPSKDIKNSQNVQFSFPSISQCSNKKLKLKSCEKNTPQKWSNYNFNDKNKYNPQFFATPKTYYTVSSIENYPPESKSLNEYNFMSKDVHISSQGDSKMFANVEPQTTAMKLNTPTEVSTGPSIKVIRVIPNRWSEPNIYSLNSAVRGSVSKVGRFPNAEHSLIAKSYLSKAKFLSNTHSSGNHSLIDNFPIEKSSLNRLKERQKSSWFTPIPKNTMFKQDKKLYDVTFFADNNFLLNGGTQAPTGASYILSHNMPAVSSNFGVFKPVVSNLRRNNILRTNVSSDLFKEKTLVPIRMTQENETLIPSLGYSEVIKNSEGVLGGQKEDVIAAGLEDWTLIPETYNLTVKEIIPPFIWDSSFSSIKNHGDKTVPPSTQSYSTTSDPKSLPPFLTMLGPPEIIISRGPPKKIENTTNRSSTTSVTTVSTTRARPVLNETRIRILRERLEKRMRATEKQVSTEKCMSIGPALSAASGNNLNSQSSRNQPFEIDLNSWPKFCANKAYQCGIVERFPGKAEPQHWIFNPIVGEKNVILREYKSTSDSNKFFDQVKHLEASFKNGTFESFINDTNAKIDLITSANFTASTLNSSALVSSISSTPKETVWEMR